MKGDPSALDAIGGTELDLSPFRIDFSLLWQGFHENRSLDLLRLYESVQLMLAIRLAHSSLAGIPAKIDHCGRPGASMLPGAERRRASCHFLTA